MKYTDMKHTRCVECAEALYEETSVMDDIQGVLHCPSCGHEVVRHEKEELAGRRGKRGGKKSK